MARTIIVLRPSGSVFPVEWTVVPEDNYWSTVYPQGREEPSICLHAREVAVSGSSVAFVVCAPTQAMAARITAFASASARAWTLAELKADNTVAAQRVKTAWRDKVSGSISFAASMAGVDYAGFVNGGT